MTTDRREKWYFTFGSGQEYEGYCQPIYGTFESAREKMIESYGTRWCMQYSEDEWEGYKNDPTRFWTMEYELPILES